MSVKFVDNALVAHGNHCAGQLYRRFVAHEGDLNMILDLFLKFYIHAQLFLRRRDGASAIEYVIIVAIVALVIIGFGTGLGDKIKGVFQKVSDALPAAT